MAYKYRLIITGCTDMKRFAEAVDYIGLHGIFEPDCRVLNHTMYMDMVAACEIAPPTPYWTVGPEEAGIAVADYPEYRDVIKMLQREYAAFSAGWYAALERTPENK